MEDDGAVGDINKMHTKLNKHSKNVTPKLAQKLMGGINREILKILRFLALENAFLKVD